MSGRHSPIPPWSPGDAIPPYQTRPDFATVINDRYGVKTTARGVENIPGLTITFLPGDKRAYVVTEPSLALLDERYRKAPRIRQNGATSRAGASA